MRDFKQRESRQTTQSSGSSWKIRFLPGKGFFYSYIRNNTTKTGLIPFTFQKSANSIKEKLVFLSSTIPVAFALLLFFVYGNHDTSNETMKPGIGGFGELPKSSQLPDTGRTIVDEHDAVLEKDEAKKDLLLAEEDESVQYNEKSGQLNKRSYVVVEGDNLTSIAQRYSVSIESIAGSSNIQLLDQLRVGQVLYIPNKEGFFYSVKKGERLAKILKKYSVSYESYVTENPGVSMDLLEVGQEIFLPGAKPDNLIRSWLVPVDTRIITSSYGWRSYPRRAFHKGLDLKAAYTSVRAAKNGRVTYAGWLGGYGNVIIIVHSGGYKSLYAHLSKIYVKPGTRVAQGTVIGRSGNTGYSFGPHLHFEVTYRGKHINPATVLTGLRYKRRSR